MPTKAVLNEILNHCNMLTKIVLNDIEYDHRAYLIACQMALPETAEISTKS